MNSAAKLRKRSVATLAASALIIGGVAPAAFAWTQIAAGPSNAAGEGSFGLTDADATKAGTQGAVAVTPGGSGQSIGQMKFVLPSTWQTGDTIDFAVGAPTPGNATQRTSFSSMPSLAFSSAYDETTHVEDLNSTTTAGNAPDPNSAGSVNGGTLTPYTPTGVETPAKAPQYTVSLVSVGSNNYQNVFRITFTNDADAAAQRAKFIGTIDAKVDVGTAVTGAIPVTATSADNSATGPTPAGTLQLMDLAGTLGNITYPAAVQPASLDVQNGSVVADGSDQNVGPLTVTAANGSTFTDGGTVQVRLDEATFAAGPVVVNYYNAAGTLVGTETIPQAAGQHTLTGTVPTASPAGDVTRVVFTNPLVTAPATGGSLTYSLIQAAGLTPLSGALGTTPGAAHQDDIMAPSAVTATQPVATDLPDRIGGQDRYQTAVKIAERALGTNPTDGPVGESDNVVIASGEGFADALSAGYLAATKQAQLILTRKGQLPQTDIEFLKTYGAKNVFIVGGTGSVSKAVEDQLKAMQSFDVQAKEQTQQEQRTVNSGTLPRTATAGGQTATLTAQFAYDDQPSAPGALSLVVARDGSGDATGITTTSPGYAVSSYAGTTATVTFTRPDGSTQSTTVTVGNGSTTVSGNDTYTFTPANTTKNVTTTVPVPGGPTDGTAVGSERKVVPLNSTLTVTRLAGNDRFETNRKVNEYAGATSINPVGSMVPEYGKPRAKTALVANGMAPWDALAAGPLVGYTGAATQYPIPLILTDGSSLNRNAKTQMQTLDIEHALFIGGKGVLPDSNMTEADGLGAYTQRIAGDDRWKTAAAISDFALKSNTASSTNKFPGLGFGGFRPYLANGGSMNGNTGSAVAKGAWADALAAGPSAARDGRIIALTDSTSLPGTTADLLKRHSADLARPVIAIGLGGVISTETVQAANAALGG